MSLYSFLEEHSLRETFILLLLAVLSQIIIFSLKRKVSKIRFLKSLFLTLVLIFTYTLIYSKIGILTHIIYWIIVLNISISFYFPLFHEIILAYVLTVKIKNRRKNEIFIFYHIFYLPDLYKNIEWYYKHLFLSTPGKIVFIKSVEKVIENYDYRLLKLNQLALKLNLTEKEKDFILTKLSWHNLNLGNIKNAEKFAKKIQSNTSKSHLLSFIYYQQGKFSKSREINHEIIYNLEVEKNELYFIALNNHAVFERNFNITLTAKNLYERNIKNVKKIKKEITHIAFQNLIDIHLLENNSDAFNLLNEYKETFKNESTNDKIKIFDYEITYYRQCNQTKKISQIINEFELHFLSKTEGIEYFIGISHLLKIAITNNLNYKQYFDKINNNIFEIIRNNSKIEALFFFMDFLDLMKSIRNQIPSNYFQNLSIISSFINSEKMTFSNYFENIPIECINHRCLNLRKLGEVENIDYIFKKLELQGAVNKIHRLEEALKIYKEYDNELEAIATLFEILNNLVEYQTYFSQKDFSPLLQTQKKNYNDAKNIISKLENSPLKMRYELELSYYAFIFKEVDLSQQLFENFIQSKISINHFKKPLQEYFYFLKQKFKH
ncbi:hypothetical protein SAMN05444280_14011 [Tangfeifania diversioriginum]|uniref:Uncharacterized protein n=2 Tax=Tangfeifania diversioriginum TaxID=1168035 RepID=A0A1M6N765_9BACT|nr:hypothetical protein SAMN05444280_14011 [Tangfeifania diversioriginum]